MTGNEIPKPKDLAEICNELIFFNTHLDYIHNQSGFLNEPPLVWAKDKFKIVEDSHTPRKHIHIHSPTGLYRDSKTSFARMVKPN